MVVQDLDDEIPNPTIRLGIEYQLDLGGSLQQQLVRRTRATDKLLTIDSDSAVAELARIRDRRE